MTEQVHKTVLENGVRVLSEHMDGVRSVSLCALVDVGPKDELSDECGYAHLIEHMLFQGTGERDAQAIAEMMEIGGGAIGAFTARDYTVYHATVLDDYLPFALEVLGDMLCNSILPAEALERQRAVILNEIAGHDDPARSVNHLLKATLWPDHPLGHPTAGLESTIRQANRQALLNFMKRHYTANKLVIAAAGNVEHSRFVSQVRDSFWQMNRHGVPEASSPPTANLCAVAAQWRALQQVYFALAWPASVYTDPERYAWHVFTALFGGGPNSQLYRRLREERGMVYHITAEYQAYGSAGALVVEGATLPQTLVSVLAGVLIELLLASGEEVDFDDHHRTVQSLISQHLVSGDSAYVRMSRLALQEKYFQRVIPSEQMITNLRAQTPAAVRNVALNVASAGLPTIALIGPLSEQMLQAVSDMLSSFGGVPALTFDIGRTPALVNQGAGH